MRVGTTAFFAAVILSLASPVQAARRSTLAGEFKRGLLDKYGAILLPAGAKAKMTNVETYKVGRATRVRGVLEIVGQGFSAKLDAMAAVGRRGNVKIDYFPSFASATSSAAKASLTEVAVYAVRIARVDREQLGRPRKLGTSVDMNKFTVAVTPLVGAHELAEVSFKSAGFMGPGSTFTEIYRVAGKKAKGRRVEIQDVRYFDNKATNSAGVDLDALY